MDIFEKEDSMIEEFMEQLSMNAGKVSIGFYETLNAIESCMAHTVILTWNHENNNSFANKNHLLKHAITVIDVKNKNKILKIKFVENECQIEEIKQRFLKKYASNNNNNNSNNNLKIEIKVENTRKLIEKKCKENNARLVIVGIHSPLSVQFLKGFMGCAAILHYELLHCNLNELTCINNDSDNDCILFEKQNMAEESMLKKKEKNKNKNKKNDFDIKKYKLMDERENYNIVMIGHVDAGKSTVAGQILLQFNNKNNNNNNNNNNNKNEKEIKILDSDEYEKERGKTFEIGKDVFNTKKRRYTIIDAPGHKKYVPNMIYGANMADIAILVVSAKKGEFESGFCDKGQTKEHAYLAYCLGIQRIIIAVNKMDDMSVNYNQSRFLQIKQEITHFLVKNVGFKKKRK